MTEKTQHEAERVSGHGRVCGEPVQCVWSPAAGDGLHQAARHPRHDAGGPVHQVGHQDDGEGGRDARIIFRLDPESKNSEIHRLLPLLGPFAQDFAGIQNKLSKAFVKLEDIDAIKEAVYLQNRNKDNNNYIEDLQEDAASANFLNDDNSSYSYLSMTMTYFLRV